MKIRALGGMTVMLVALVLAACGDDETTTVTTTAAAGSGGEATEETAAGTDEAAAEEIAPPPDAKAEQDIAEIQQGIEEARQDAGGDTAVPGSGDVPALSFQQASSGLENARYCSKYVIAGANTSCAFALNVAYQYFRLNRARRFTAYSPTTGLYYEVRCKYVHPTLCRAGNGAVIAIA